MEATFNLTGEDGSEKFEGVDSFKYLGRIMHWSDNDWPAQKLRQVWGRLWNLLRWEGADPFVLAKFYRAVVQAVLLLGADTWVMMAEISQKL